MVHYGATPVTFTRTDIERLSASLEIDLDRRGEPIPKSIFGNFLEHLGFAIYGGIWAQILSNPGFERVHNLSDRARQALLYNGTILKEYCHSNQTPPGWLPRIGSTGFGVAALDDFSDQGIPFPWAPLGAEGVSDSLGRLGGAVRLQGTPVKRSQAGVRQGIFLPLQRTLDYQGDLIVRAASHERADCGQVRVGLRRRSETPDMLGEILVEACLDVNGGSWVKVPFNLHLESGSIRPHEPLDFYIVWHPNRHIKSDGTDLLVDRAQLFPNDAIEGMDPDVIRKVREWNVPLLRWPGGNFVSHYHWRDGIGAFDRRPTRPNYAWGGLEYNAFGTVEFIHFCKLVGCQPHLVVNSGMGTPEEAAAWVEFCNGSPETTMGKLRARQGDIEPYGVHLWEVGNEIYGAWQGGYHGEEENACRFVEFAGAMRRVDPSIELIATGNPFDFVQPGPRFDRTHADQNWHRTLIETGGQDLDYISLHSLPIATEYPDGIGDEEVYYSILSQPAVWERIFLPDLLAIADDLLPAENGRKPIRLAITEWGALGGNPHRPRVENYSGALYAGVFLNMLLRNAGRIPIANATALLHGGCIRKAAGQVFVDAQYSALQQYACLFPGSRALACRLEGRGFDVQVGADLGAPVCDVPYVDAAACLVVDDRGGADRLIISTVNLHLTHNLLFNVRLSSGVLHGQANLTRLAYPDPYGVASLADSDRFALQAENLVIHDGCLQVELPPCSINWISINV